MVGALSSHMSLGQGRYRTFPPSVKVLRDSTGLGEGRYKTRKIYNQNILKCQDNILFNLKRLKFDKGRDNIQIIES